MSRALDRTAILAVEDLPRLAVEVPEWGGRVYVRMMSAGERDAWESSIVASPDKDVRARLAVAVLCDENGEALFSAADIPAVSKKSGRALDRVFAAATKHNKMSRADIDELKKNS